MSGLPGLVGRMAQACIWLKLSTAHDSHGGKAETWTAAGGFTAAVSTTGPTGQSSVASRPDSVATCTLTAPLGTGLGFHDRVATADGRTLLIVSEAKDRHTPSPASFSFERYECEEVIDG